jgi:RNA polymerase primary sigma factor
MSQQSVRPSQHSVNRLLSIAAAAGAEAAVRLHIARGDDLECRDRRGFTPLMIAASKNSAGVCRLLLQAGADVTAREPGGRDALDIARETASAAAAEAIIECTGKPAPHPDREQNHGITPCAQTITAPWLSIKDGGDARSDAIPAEVPAAARRFDVETDDASAAPSHGVPVDLEKGAAIYVKVPASRECEESGNGPDRATQAALGDASPVETDDTDAESLFGDWVPAIAPEAPPDDPVFAQAEVRRQQRINEHEPIDDSADWSDFEADLPEFANPLPREDDAEYLTELRRILLLAAREGSVPRTAVEDLLSERGDAASRDQIAEAQLKVVIGALGAELDERLELSLGTESFKLYVDPKESSEEEREIDEALIFFHDLRSGRYDPLRIYMRSIAQKALLDGKREIAIAQAMEASASRALDALARWPTGLHALLDAVAGAESNPAVLLPVVMTAREGVDAADETSDSSENDALPSSLQGEDASGEQSKNAETPFSADSATSVAEAIAAFGRIRVLTGSPSQSGLILEQLRALSFRRTFLANLGDRSPADRSAEAAEYRNAIAALLAGREEMVRGNLRLVYATAKRYLNSGIPLDDLMQEGNIGLLKAVDRFDWRRGYKFSTMAIWWIRQQISRSTSDTAFNIRVPVHVSEKVSKQRQAAEAFERANGRPPSPLERAAMLGVSVQKMEMLLRPSSDPIPIDEAPLHWNPASEELTDPMDIVANCEVARLLADRLAALGRKTELIIRMRFGIGLDGDQTLEQVGNVLAITRERVRQIESKGIRRLSSTSSREALAIALGRPLPIHPEPAPEKSSITADHASQEITGQSESNAGIESLPPAVRRVLDLARLLGLRVEVETGNRPLVILVEDVLPVDQDSQKLVADMLQIGFAYEPGMGYRL